MRDLNIVQTSSILFIVSFQLEPAFASLRVIRNLEA